MTMLLLRKAFVKPHLRRLPAQTVAVAGHHRADGASALPALPPPPTGNDEDEWWEWHHQRQAAQDERRRAEIKAQDDERDRQDAAETARIEAAPVPEGHKRSYYATMRRQHEDPAKRTAWLAGPFDRHAEARDHVGRARDAAVQIDGKHWFNTFGTASITVPRERALPYGKLNHLLGLPHAGPSGVQEVEPLKKAAVALFRVAKVS